MTNLAHYTFLGNCKNIILKTWNFSVIFNHCAYFVAKSRGKLSSEINFEVRNRKCDWSRLALLLFLGVFVFENVETKARNAFREEDVAKIGDDWSWISQRLNERGKWNLIIPGAAAALDNLAHDRWWSDSLLRVGAMREVRGKVQTWVCLLLIDFHVKHRAKSWPSHKLMSSWSAKLCNSF